MTARSLADVILGVGADVVDREVRPCEFGIGAQPDPYRFGEDAVDQESVYQGKDDGGEASHELRDEGDSAQAAERLAAEDTCGDAAPGADDAVQRPDAQ